MTQRDLFPDFDAAASEEARADGMGRAADNHRALLNYARRLAVEIACAREDRTCTADDVQRALVENGFSVFALGNAAGSLFARRGWRWTGRWVRSVRVHAHRNDIRVWRWEGAAPEPRGDDVDLVNGGRG